MSEWKEISQQQNLELSKKLLEQQGRINALTAELADINARVAADKRVLDAADDTSPATDGPIDLEAIAQQVRNLWANPVAMLRTLATWRRANGWQHTIAHLDVRSPDGAPTGEDRRLHRWTDGDAEIKVYLQVGPDDRWSVLDRILYRDDDGEDMAIWDGPLIQRLGFRRSVMSVLAAAGILGTDEHFAEVQRLVGQAAVDARRALTGEQTGDSRG